MSSLTWITEKELEREKKKQRTPIPLEEKHKNLIAAVRKKGILAAIKVKISASEKNKVTRKTYSISSIKRVTRKFLEVSRCIRAKQRQSNEKKKRAKLFFLIRKKGCCTCKVFFLIRPNDFFGCFRCVRRLALHDFIFCLVNYRY